MPRSARGRSRTEGPRALAATSGSGSHEEVESATDDVMRLSDGRRVAFATWGDLSAPVVVYCHGTPGSRHELRLAHEALTRSGVAVRLIAPNRPGYGPSTPVRDVGFRSWSRDLAEVADRLAVDRFAVLGGSGGAPFALAAAIELGDRITRVGIVGGVAPPEAAGMDRSAALTEEPANPMLRRATYLLGSLAIRAALNKRMSTRLISALPQPDQEALASASARAALGAMMREAFAHGGRAGAHESGLFRQPWEIDVGAVSQPVGVWHGEQDTRVPAEAGRWLAGRLRDARLTLWPDHGHFSWATSDAIGAIVSFLTAPE